MSSSRQRILVAGATGYLGGYVAKEFKSRGHFVRALARSLQKLDYMKNEVDEIVEGRVTEPESIEGVCDGIHVVFSSIGLTKQKDNLTFKDVDYQGNLNLLETARKAGVSKFIYVSVYNGPALKHLDIVKAHEDFVDELKASGLNYAVIRPTGYFSDMGELLEMARKGRVYLFGPGHNKMNPIHGADLAVVCVDALETDQGEINVGGPEVLSWREMAESARNALGKPVRIWSIPTWLVKASVAVARVFNRHQGELLAFFTEMGTREVIAPAAGRRKLDDYYIKLAGRETE